MEWYILVAIHSIPQSTTNLTAKYNTATFDLRQARSGTIARKILLRATKACLSFGGRLRTAYNYQGDGNIIDSNRAHKSILYVAVTELFIC